MSNWSRGPLAIAPGLSSKNSFLAPHPRKFPFPTLTNFPSAAAALGRCCWMVLNWAWWLLDVSGYRNKSTPPSFLLLLSCEVNSSGYDKKTVSRKRQLVLFHSWMLPKHWVKENIMDQLSPAIDSWSLDFLKWKTGISWSPVNSMMNLELCQYSDTFYPISYDISTKQEEQLNQSCILLTGP